MRTLVSQGQCDTTMTERFVPIDCVCDTYEGNLGPCATFEATTSGKCVYCNHRQACHEVSTVVHQCPPVGSGLMPCCNRTPFEVRLDRMTLDTKQVTCGKEK